ncbi:unnamed protein product [Dibothriocephalus latus]|uniref:Uncharacterized protein n=1 Tax=Dibothriocephalus latus TaxID=60516 RepID=A0A3P7N5U4_DIBLA|nr:unnamed protein product [Dibothriocephalus latus]
MTLSNLSQCAAVRFGVLITDSHTRAVASKTALSLTAPCCTLTLDNGGGTQSGAIYLITPIRDKMLSRFRIVEKNLVQCVGTVAGLVPRFCSSTVGFNEVTHDSEVNIRVTGSSSEEEEDATTGTRALLS